MRTFAVKFAACWFVFGCAIPSLAEESPSLLRSEQGRDTQIRLVQFDAGRDAKYVVAARTDRSSASEWLWPTSRLVPTDIVYDCTEEVLHGKAKPILCDLSRTAVRVFAILPTQVEQIELRGAASVSAGQPLTAAVEFRDAGGKRLHARLPFHVALRSPDDVTLHEAYLTTRLDGTWTIELPPPANPAPGTWRVVVRSQLNGLTASLPIEILPVATGDSSLPRRITSHSSSP